MYSKGPIGEWVNRGENRALRAYTVFFAEDSSDPRSGKSPVPLRIMSYPESITEEQFNDYRKRLYLRVYGYKGKDLGGSAPNTPASL